MKDNTFTDGHSAMSPVPWEWQDDDLDDDFDDEDLFAHNVLVELAVCKPVTCPETGKRQYLCTFEYTYYGKRDTLDILTDEFPDAEYSFPTTAIKNGPLIYSELAEKISKERKINRAIYTLVFSIPVVSAIIYIIINSTH